MFPLIAARAAVAPAPTRPEALVLTVEGRVQTLRFGGASWRSAQTNEALLIKDQLRTGFKSRSTVRLSDESVLRLNQLTTIQIQPPAQERKRLLELKVGECYFFNRDQPGETGFQTPQASGAIRGTEFDLQVTDAGATVLTLLDGEVDMTNKLGSIQLRSGEQGIAEPGRPPRKTAVINAINIIQWALYYPGVLDLDELRLAPADQNDLRGSLQAYRAGDLLGALRLYPTNRPPGSAEDQLYAAALNLSAGQVEASEQLLAGVNAPANSNASRIAGALNELIAAVKYQPWARPAPPQLATEWLAESYYWQSHFQLDRALTAARKAAQQSPNFGFAWERAAELEFSFGRTPQAMEALEKSIRLSPRNAQALALRGFLRAAQNRIGAAETAFDEAIAADGALGNAWLGRGLVRIKRGRARSGREDLQTAAALEPNRAILRSYLGKAFSNEGDLKRAAKELAWARKLDPNDPTSWLYSALLNQQRNRLNEAVADLEKSKDLNDNRQLFRSKLLLDQDRAVRGANLANIYREEGMTDYSVREASKAVDDDFGNYSAHLFLAESYDALRDPRQVNLRYEAPWMNELLLANLLAPVGAGNLSQNISQQEYSKLFQQDGLGVSSYSEYQSRGAWLENGSQYGTFGNSSYSFDVNYNVDPGWRPNDDFESLTWYAKLKHQFDPQNNLFLETIYYNFDAGDVAEYYNQNSASLTRRVHEEQQPMVFAGFNHEWAPNSHTLFLAGRLQDTFQIADPNSSPVFLRYAGGYPGGAPFGFDENATKELSLNYRSQLQGLTTEIEHILDLPNQTWVFGGRYQAAWVTTRSRIANPTLGASNLAETISDQSIDSELDRGSVYAYDTWQALDSLQLTAGLTYDHLQFPLNIDTSPITPKNQSKDQVSPKLGLVWTPIRDTDFRADYTRSLGGVFFDNSVRLEPVQIAGFTQTYRSLIPESAGGLVPGTRFETWGFGIDHKFPTQTYVILEGQHLDSTGNRLVGAFANGGIAPTPDTPIQLDQGLNYGESSVLLTLNQLAGDEWSFGASYRLTHSSLSASSGSFPSTVENAYVLDQRIGSDLHTVYLYSTYTHPCGFFGAFYTSWYDQSNRGRFYDEPGDNFWQLNFFAGYRLPRQRAEIRVGVLNLTDRDYKLDPLTYYVEFPRRRTFIASLRFNF